MTSISFIVPVFNEEQAVPYFYQAVEDFKARVTDQYEVSILFINDGSTDRTLDVIKVLAGRDQTLRMVSFSRNFGKEVALFAGLEYSTSDIVVPIDVDLQDPLDAVYDMLKRHEEGYDVVLGKRMDRSTDSFMKKKSAELFYRFHNKISKPKIEENVGDFRLMTRRVVTELVKLRETQLFMKGLLSWVGFKTAIVEYKRENRVAGDTKFNGWQLWNLALEGVTSFSTFPLKIWTYLGFIMAIISFSLIIKVLIQKWFFGIAISGYASLMVAILCLGGFILMGVGILGEYIGRIYLEVKGRPRYIVDECIGFEAK